MPGAGGGKHGAEVESGHSHLVACDDRGAGTRQLRERRGPPFASIVQPTHQVFRKCRWAEAGTADRTDHGSHAIGVASDLDGGADRLPVVLWRTKERVEGPHHAWNDKRGNSLPPLHVP